jgi:hypothetical protein
VLNVTEQTCRLRDILASESSAVQRDHGLVKTALNSPIASPDTQPLDQWIETEEKRKCYYFRDSLADRLLCNTGDVNIQQGRTRQPTGKVA